MPRTEGEIEALIRAHAGDLAAAENVRSQTPPFLQELVATFWHRLFRENHVPHERLAASVEEQRVAAVRATIAGERMRLFARRVRELASERKRMERPATGVTLTRPEALFFCVVPGIVIEVFGTAPSLDAAFDLGKYLSWLFAAAISGVLILAAEQLGNTLASGASASRRQARWTATALLAIAIGAGVFTVISLAESRATNLAFKQAGQLNLSAQNSNGSFEGTPETGKPAAAGAFGAKPAAAAEAPSSPDYSFFIPLSVLVMATAMLFAYRIEMAHDWNELALALDEAEGELDEARSERASAAEAERRAGTPEEEIVGEAAVAVEREHGLLTLWMARFMAEYQRFCAALGNSPQRLTVPPIPDTVDALQRMIDPRRRDGRWRRPAGGGGNGDGPRPSPGGPTGAGAGENGPNGGEPGGGESSGGGSGQGERPDPEPSPSPAGAGPERPRRSDRRGAPRRFGGGG